MYQIKSKYSNLPKDIQTKYKNKKDKYGMVFIPIDEITLEGLKKKYKREKDLHNRLMNKIIDQLNIKSSLEDKMKFLSQELDRYKETHRKLTESLDNNSRLSNIETTLEQLEKRIIVLSDEETLNIIKMEVLVA